MKKIVMLVAIALAVMTLTGCSRFAPDAGYETVLVKKPWFFGHGGIEDEPVKTGLTFGAITTSGINVYMQPQKFDVAFDDAMTSDGVPIDFHATLVVKVEDSVRLISKFGADWYKNNLEDPFRKMVRQAVRNHGMNETAISSTAIDQIDAKIEGELTTYIKERELPISLIALTIGKANPPDSVKNQRVETAAQQQRVETEKQKKLAEDERKAAETARAMADNAYRQAMSLSPEQFLQLEAIKMQQVVCGPEGKGTCTFIQGTGAVTPVYNLARKPGVE